MRMSYEDIFETVKSNGYHLAKCGKTDAIEEDYYKLCEKENIPLIKAYAGSKYAHVSIDLITISYNLSTEGKNRIDVLYRNYTRKSSSIGSSHGYCSVDDVPNDSGGYLSQRNYTDIRGLQSTTNEFNK
jgi:hypothetical protein